MLYLIGRSFFRLLFRVVFRYRVIGRDKIPSEGGVLLVANHAHALDPPLLGSAVRRPVHFMAKAELFRLPFLRWALPKVHAFPVRRGSADRAAVRTAVERLRKGHVVGLFPEGTRTRTGELQPLQRGAGLIAVRADVPVIPVAIKHTFRPIRWEGWRPRINRFAVVIGDPLDMASVRGDEQGARESIDRANQLMWKGIRALLETES